MTYLSPASPIPPPRFSTLLLPELKLLFPSIHSLLFFHFNIYSLFGYTANASTKSFQESRVYTSRSSLSSCLLATLSLPIQACALLPRNPFSSSSSVSHSAWPSTPAAFSTQCLVAGRLAFSRPFQSVLTSWHLTRPWTVCRVYCLGVCIY